MVKINKVYTRTGDDGTTQLVGGERVNKNSIKVTSYGEVDELNSWIGLVRTILSKDSTIQQLSGLLTNSISHLETIQNTLFDIGAILASPPELSWPTKRIITPSDIARMEDWIDNLTNQTPELRSFVLPGGSIVNSYLHIARTVCRRAERSILTLNEVETVPSGILQFINRLSDYLFVLSRAEICLSGGTEYLWSPSKESPIVVDRAKKGDEVGTKIKLDQEEQ